MSSRGRVSAAGRRSVAMVAATLLLAGAAVVAMPGQADAVGTVLFQNTFNHRTVDGVGSVVVPTPTSGTNVACLSAAGNSATRPLLSCADATDPQGSGKLRLTSATGDQIGGVFGETSFPSSNGLDVTFNTYQWGGGGADGLSFVLAAVDPANPTTPMKIGPGGGSLGYGPFGSSQGLPNAYLGVGLDVFGNFSSSLFQGTGCTSVPNIGASAAGAIVVRGPGNASAGYCGLTTTYTGAPASRVTLRATTRAASVVPVQVLINPTASAFASPSGVTVNAGTYKVVATPVGQPAKTLTGPLPAVSAGVYPTTSWLTAAGIPRQLAFGFVGSTGAVTDHHEVSDVKVLTFNPVPQLLVTSTSYTAAPPAPGAPVTYRIAASVQVGVDEASPVSMTQTTPTGVVPVGAYGSGWVCATPVGQTVTCTTSGSSFADGTALPVITVVAIVTGAGVTAATVQNASVARVSSVDANPDMVTTTIAGALPSAPTGITPVPASGPIVGGGSVTVAGANITGATAIEIGTAAEQTAGTPVVLLPCPTAVPVAGCFVVSGGSLYISQMPPRASAAVVGMTVVTAGRAAAGTYTYVSAPGAPAAPGATAGITSATVTWVAPASNGGSPVTGYTVTAYLGAVVAGTATVGGSLLSTTLTGLTAGGSYTFTVAATNSQGTSAPSAKSGAVVPYALPGAPTISAATAGDSSAVLAWTAPSNGGSTITGYVVTPYIGAVPQPTQAFGVGLTQTVTGLAAGTAYTFAVAAQNAAGTGPSSTQSSAVVPNVSPTLSFPPPPAGQVGVPYSRQLTATNGTSPFTWSISSGTLPPGMNLAAAGGLLGGTPTAAGSYTFTVQVVDASGQSATKSVTLVIAAGPVLTFVPGPGEVAVPFSQQPALSGGTGPFTWSITGGSLPAGLSIGSASGLISGTPTTAGSRTITVSATDSFGQIASRSATIVIVALPTLTFTGPPTGQVAISYSSSLEVTGGTLPLIWSITAGSLPAGLALNGSTGLVSGTPTTAGSSPFTVSVVDANGQGTSRATTIVVGAGPLVIVKSANVSSAASGDTVAYTITLTNTGPSPITGVSISDSLAAVLDDASYGGNATASSGTLGYAASTLGWSGTVPATAPVTISYSVTINTPDTGNKVLSNAVTSSTLGTNCPVGGVDSRCAATVTVAGLSMVKTANVSATTPGGTVGYTVLVTNTGQTAYVGATLTESLARVLDDGVYNGDAAATTGSVSYTSPSLTWTGNLAVGATATITYSVTVANPDTGNRSLASTVVSSTAGSTCPSGAPAPSCTATVAVQVPALSITNSSSVSSTTPGSAVAYTVTAANTGQTASTGAVLTIALGGALDDASYTDAFVATMGSVSYDPATTSLTWTGDLAVGASVTITGSLTVLDPDPGDRTLTTVVSSAAPGSTCPAGSANPSCASTVPVNVPELSISTAAGVGSTTPGSVVQYSLSITNTGQVPYTAAAVASALAGALDDATYDGDAVATTGTVTRSGSVLSWAGDLLVGATATVTYSMTVSTPDAGDRTLSVRATSSTAGSTCPAASTDPRCVSVVPVLLPALTITAEADGATTTPGGTVRYSFTASNTGQTTYTGTVVTLDLRGAVDDAAYNNDASATSGSQVANGDGTITWTLTLAPGETATSTMSATVTAAPAGDKVLRTTAVSLAPGSSCPAASSAAACHSEVTVLTPGLVITKTANAATVVPGGVVSYTISVLNTGETTYAAAGFDDDLSQVEIATIYADDATATTGAVSSTGSVLSWSGTLAPGASATVTYSVTVRDPAPGDKRLLNSAVSSAPGSNCAPGGSDPRCTASVFITVPGMTITTTSTSATAIPGATIDYRVSVRNSGATAFTATSVSDSLAGLLDDADYNGDAAADTGSVGLVGQTLTWTGDLAVGATAVITFSATVHAADGGDNLVTSTVTSSATGNNCAPGSDDVRCGAVVPVARLLIRQVADSATTTPGSTVRLNQTFTNTGQVPYTGVSIVSPRADTSDDTTPTGDQVASSGTLVRTATAVTWTGDIPVGGVVTSTRTLIVQDPAPGNRVITATLSSEAPGSNCPLGGSDPLCTFSVSVLLPELTIHKVASTTSAEPGDTVDYTITVANTGETAYSGAAVTDLLAGVLDDAGYDGNAVVTIGVVSYTAPTLAWSGDLEVDDVATISYSVTVDDPAAGDNTMVNPVSSTTVGSTCPPATGNPACRSSVDVLTPALTIVKTADRAHATLGTTISYTIVATNTGQTTFASAELADDLADVVDDATYGDDAAATSGTLQYDDGVLAWSGSLAPGDAVEVTYTAFINNPGSGDGTMSNTVVSPTRGSNCVEGAADSRCAATVIITDSVSLTFTKTSSVVSTVAGGVVSYTVTVANTDTIAVDGATYNDPLADILDDAAYNGDAIASLGNIALTDSTLTWDGDLEPGDTASITYSVMVDATSSGDMLLGGTISSTSLPTSNNCSVGSNDPRCTNVVPVASLLIEQAAGSPTTTPGSVVTLTQTFRNTGQVPYLGISIVSPRANTSDDTVPTGDQSVSSGTLTRTATTVVWTGDIPVGGTVTSTRTLIVKDPDPGNRLITATLSSDAPGNNCPVAGGDALCTFSVAVLIPGLTIEKTSNATTIEPGETVHYTIVVDNTGEAPYAAAAITDSLVGLLDDAGYGNDALATTGIVGYDSSAVSWTGSLAVGERATITYSATAFSPATGDKTMINSVSSTTVGNTCPPATANAACRANVSILTPGLTISSTAGTANTVPGAVVSYTITAANTGQTSYSSAGFTVPLTGVLDDATYGGGATASSGTVVIADGAVTWSGELAPESVATITYSVTVDPVPGGSFQLDQTVSSANHGSNCPAGAQCTTAVPIANLLIANSADAPEAQPTSVVRNTVTLTNAGKVPYVGISVSDSFVGSLDDATYNGDATATAGSMLLVVGSGRVVWTGDLAVGATVTVTGSLTVNNPDLGDKVMTTRVTTDAIASSCPTASPGSTCFSSVSVLTPQLTLSTSSDRTTAGPGEPVEYTVTVANAGETSYTAVTVTDTLTGLLDDADYNGDALASIGAVAVVGSSLVWTGDLAVGESAIITYSATVANPDPGDGTLVERLSSAEIGSSCLPGGSGVACSTTVTILTPALVMTIAPDRTTTVPGGVVGYLVTISNSGETDYTAASVGVRLDDVLDDADYAGGATTDSGTVSYTEPALTWDGDIAIGGTVAISFVVTVDEPDVGNRTLLASVGSAAPGSSCTDALPCSSAVAVLIPGLSVSVATSVTTTTPGSDVDVTITVVNTGQTPYPAATVSAGLDDMLDDAELVGPLSASSGVATHDDHELSWTGGLAVGATATIGYRVAVHDPDLGNLVLSTTLLAAEQGSTCQADSTDAACTASVTVLVPQLTLSKTADVETTTPGAVVVYTILVVNSGQTDYPDATVTDSLDQVLSDADYNGDAGVVGGGILEYEAPVLGWSGALPIGASATITYSVTIHDPDTGDKLVTNSVVSTSPGSTCPPGSSLTACTAQVRVLIPGLQIVKTTDAATVVAGGTVAYTVTVTNTGETDYLPARMTDPLDAVLDVGTYDGNGTASRGVLEYVGTTLVWTGPLLVGDSAVISYSVTADFPVRGSGTLHNAAFSTSPGAGCVIGTEPGCSTDVDVLVPGLSITKTADSTEVVAGGTVRYTISATNTGEADYAAATITDVLADVLDDGSYSSDASVTSGAVTYADGVLGWSGTLIQGATVTISYSVDVPVDTSGDGILTNLVTSPSTGSTCTTGSEPGCSTTTDVAARSIELSALTSSFTLTGPPQSTVTLDNSVGMTVTTNSTSGYVVAVQAVAPWLTALDPDNDDTIPVGNLRVRESATTLFRPLSDTASLIVHEQGTSSSPLGDAVSNDYQMEIPFVAGDTYSVSLDYIVSAQ